MWYGLSPSVSQKVHAAWYYFRHVWLCATLWTVACQVPLSMGFSRQEYWSGLPCPSPGDLPDPEIEHTSPVSPALQADSLPTEPPGKPGSKIWTYFWTMPVLWSGKTYLQGHWGRQNFGPYDLHTLVSQPQLFCLTWQKGVCRCTQGC